jgi:hypothetical protein
VEESFYERLFVELHRKRVRYVLCGGLAVNLHGVPRITADADIAMDFAEDNVRALVRVAGLLGLRPATPVDPLELASAARRREWREQKGAVVFQFVDPCRPYLKLDVLLDPLVTFAELRAGRSRLFLGTAEVAVASIDHLIALKQGVDPPREQDLADVRALTKVREILGRRDRDGA